MLPIQRSSSTPTIILSKNNPFPSLCLSFSGHGPGVLHTRAPRNHLSRKFTFTNPQGSPSSWPHIHHSASCQISCRSYWRSSPESEAGLPWLFEEQSLQNRWVRIPWILQRHRAMEQLTGVNALEKSRSCREKSTVWISRCRDRIFPLDSIWRWNTSNSRTSPWP